MKVLRLGLFLKVVNVGYQKYLRLPTETGVKSTGFFMPIKRFLNRGYRKPSAVRFFILKLSFTQIERRQMNPFNDNDIALIVRPNLDGGKWDGTVNLNILSMPSPDLSQEAAEDLLYMVNGLVACFHLLNSDAVFANKVSVYMEKLRAEEERAESLQPTADNVVQLDQWTKTKGTA
jgi:hypothetical protein